MPPSVLILRNFLICSPLALDFLSLLSRANNIIEESEMSS